MKTKFPLVLLAICLFVAPSALASPDKDDSRYTDVKVATVQLKVDNHETRIKNLETSVKTDSQNQNMRIQNLESTVSNLTAQLIELKNWGENKWIAGQNALKKTDQKIEKVNRKSSYSLWLLFPAVAIVVGILGFAIWPRKTVGPSFPPVPDHPKCPRCGWEHDPSDTVCKNPNCKVQF